MIYTAINRAYFPGLVALANSIAEHSPATPLTCLVYGDDHLVEEVRARGVTVVANPPVEAYLPTSWRCPVGQPAMYARLIVPDLHAGDSPAVWLDADQVVLADLRTLLDTTAYGGHAVGAVEHPAPLGDAVSGLPRDEAALRTLYAGLLVYNTPAWRAQEIRDRCFAVMEHARSNGRQYQYVVQSVLGEVLAGRFHRLHPSWQRFGNRSELLPADARVVHWHGHSRNPWTWPMNNLELWKRYYR